MINAGLLKILYRAIYSNRTLILHGKWQWTGNLKYCMHKGTKKQIRGMNCYTMPTSNCKYDKLIKYFGIDSEYKGRLPTNCSIGDNRTLPLCKQRIITINKRQEGWGYFPEPSTMDKWLLYKFRINYNTFRAVSTSFFFRLNSKVRKIIYEKIRNAWINSLRTVYNGNINDITINPVNTISIPIRHSDKCKMHHKGGEMECWTVKEYIGFLESVAFLSNNRIDTVIITSESTEFVNNLTMSIKEYDNKWNFSKHKWKRVIINKDDISSQIGASDYLLNRERYEEFLSYADDRLGTSLEFDPIVGALSSMLLQISNSKYIVFTKSSNWLDLIWSLSKHLNCEYIFWKDYGLYHNKFDININLNKQCFEFNQYGLAHKMTFRKSINYPSEFWEIIKREFKGDLHFEKTFGVRSKSSKPCSTYHINPWQHSDTLY